jgi:2-keto-4-pentenoate hydratase/2-oxohepta-3-ene-1,7-dioic acid hydratase in catechol pathway
MKICRFLHENVERYGVFHEGRIFLLPPAAAAAADAFAGDAEKLRLGESFDPAEVKFLPPTAPSKIVCVGRNYAAHAAELGNETPSEPLLFLKAPSALITHNQPIKLPPQSAQVEHEGELAVVIGRECGKLTETDDPFPYVFGYTCLNDVTARDLQRKDGQFTRAKSFDTFCPIGAFIETELNFSSAADDAGFRVITRVNGEIKQDGRTGQMVFPVGFLIRYISNMMTLKPGDIIATGTPAGVSQLRPGDVCEVEIEGVGILRNPVE